jgi:hypothetical protein
VLKIDGPSEYFDDALSEDDKYILCGGHHSKVGHETTILYWWPKPSVWAASGFNLGYWSEVAEDWFRHCHREIKSRPQSTNCVPIPKRENRFIAVRYAS